MTDLRKNTLGGGEPTAPTGSLISKTISGILTGAGSRMLCSIGVKALGVLFNTVFGLQREPSNQDLMDKLDDMDSELHEILDGIQEVEDDLKKLSSQLEYTKDVIVNEIDSAAMQPFVSSIEQWFDIDYMNICPGGPDTCADTSYIENLVNTILDNTAGIEVVLTNLNNDIAGSVVEGGLRSTMDTLITGRRSDDPLGVYLSYENYFIQMVWLQLKGLILMVDAMSYQQDHLQEKSGKTVSWTGDTLSYCTAVFIPNLKNQTQIFLQCVEKLVASLKELSKDPHQFISDESKKIFFRADLLAYQMGGFLNTIQDDQGNNDVSLDRKDAFVVRLVGNPDWISRYGSNLTTTITPSQGPSVQMDLVALPNYDANNLMADTRQFDARGLYPALILDKTGDQKNFTSFTSQSTVEMSKYTPAADDILSLTTGQSLGLDLPAPFDDVSYTFEAFDLNEGEDQPEQEPFYFYHLVILEPYVNGINSTSWGSGTSLVLTPPTENAIHVDKKTWYTGRIDGYPTSGFDLSLTINSGVYDEWKYEANVSTGLFLVYQGEQELKAVKVFYEVEASVVQDPGKKDDYKKNTSAIGVTMPYTPLSVIDFTPNTSSQEWILSGNTQSVSIAAFTTPPPFIEFVFSMHGEANWNTSFWTSDRTFKNKAVIKITDWWLEYPE
jgi:hypothetical protein